MTDERADERWRVLVVDDHPCVRRALIGILGDTDDLVVVAQAGLGRDVPAMLAKLSAEQAVRQPTRQPVDLAIVDLALPDGDGADVIAEIKRSHPGIACLAFTFQSHRPPVVAAMRAGADGYVLKTSDPDDLLRAIAAVRRGGLYVDPDVAAHLAPMPGSGARSASPCTKGPCTKSSRTNGASHADTATESRAAISPRECEVLRYFALGLTAKETARRLTLSVKTIETYKARGTSKLALVSRADIVRYAAREGWLQPSAL